ncbi:MAG: hypothetical protein RL028_113 [Actinomycetota bacterium]|jgi:hypothetical protein
MKWTIFGKRPINPAPSWTPAILAFIFASQTFIDSSAGYPAYMSYLAFVSGAWFFYLGIKAKALISFLFVPVAAAWVLPLLAIDPFTKMNAVTFSAHSLLALLFGVAAYTYCARERVKK